MDDRIVDDLRKTIEQLKALRETAYRQYSAAVELVISDQITDPNEV